MPTPLEPAIAEMVASFIAAGRPRASELSWQARREGYLASAVLGGEREDVGQIEEWCESHYAIRLYRPAEPTPSQSALIYFHGGCFVSGEFETHDRQLRMLCNRANAPIFAVHTRLAPEHPYPAAHDDALAATLAIMTLWPERGPDQFVLAGDSAGGHLALVTALRLKAMGAPQPRALCLLYPMLDARGQSQSYREHGDDYLITADMLLSGYRAYLGTLPADHPEASPLHHPELTGLPPPISSPPNTIPCAMREKHSIAPCSKPASRPVASASSASSTASSSWPASVRRRGRRSRRWPHSSGLAELVLTWPLC